MEEWREQAQALVDRVISPQGITDSRILEAMKRVPRHLFIPAELREYSYIDSPLSIGEEQTISQPFMVAKMTHLLSLEPGNKVLEIGTGSGYQAAILAEMGMKVTTIERIEELARRARKVFGELSYDIHSIIGDGREGFTQDAPYQGVIVTAGTGKMGESWLDQLVEGGRIVAPLVVKEGIYRLLVRHKKSHMEAGYLDTWYDYCRFVPLLPGVRH